MWLASLSKHLTTGQTLPADLLENFKDFPDKQSSPTTAKNLDAKAINQSQTQPEEILSVSPSSNKSDLAKRKFDSEIESPLDGNKRIPNGLSCSINDLSCTSPPPPSNSASNDTTQGPSFRDIPKSPHLSKDFSPNGERLRNSIRARRQERLAKQRSMRTFTPFSSQLSTCSSDAGSETSGANLDDSEEFSSSLSCRPFGRVNELKTSSMNQRRRTKPYGDKGFIINVNDGLLTINDVKDLNNCCSDDFDSSCDTSLNYIDCNVSSPTLDNLASVNASLKTVLNGMKTENFDEDDENVNKASKETLDNLREEMNKCKTKLDALKITNNGVTSKKISNLSLRDMSSPKKKIETKDNGKTMTATVTAPLSSPIRLNALSPPIFNNRTTGSNANNNKTDANYPTKKVQTKRNNSSASQTVKTNKCNNKIFTNNSSPIRIDRNGATSIGNVDAVKTTKSNNESILNSPKKVTNDFILDKYNKMNNRVYSNDTNAADSLARKPPPIASTKKKDGTKNGLKSTDKVPAHKKTSSIISSSTRKFL